LEKEKSRKHIILKKYIPAVFNTIAAAVIYLMAYFAAKYAQINELIVFIPSVILLLFVNILILKLTQKDISSVNETLRKIINGEESLNKRIELSTHGQFSLLVEELNSLIEKVKTIIVSIIENTNSVATSGDLLAESVANATDKIAYTIKSIKKVEGSIKSQASMVNETSDTMGVLLSKLDGIHSSINTQSGKIENSSKNIKELVTSINGVAEASFEAEKTAKSLKDVAMEGSDSVESAVIAIEEIEGASKEITDVIKIIRGISEQTNLLAMNAAIEAAHAGKHGEGFAVVADEVRKLAENSKSRTKEINDAIKGIMDKIKNGVILSKKAGESLKRIMNDVSATVLMIDKIYTETTQQRSQAQDIMQALASIEEVTSNIQDFMADQKKSASRISDVMSELNNITENIKDDIMEQGKNSESVVQSVLQINDIANENTITVIQLESTARQFKIDE
jgi:methyl-accepting chemotaxis protein